MNAWRNGVIESIDGTIFVRPRMRVKEFTLTSSRLETWGSVNFCRFGVIGIRDVMVDNQEVCISAQFRFGRLRVADLALSWAMHTRLSQEGVLGSPQLDVGFHEEWVCRTTGSSNVPALFDWGRIDVYYDIKNAAAIRFTYF